MHPFLDNPEEVDIIDDAFQPFKRTDILVVEDVEVDFESIACRQFFLEYTMSARKDQFVQLDGDHAECFYARPFAERYLSASSAAIQPLPAAVTA